MIRGFLFDYDGVMTQNNAASPAPSEKLNDVLNLPPEEIQELFSSFWADYLRGKITDEELWHVIEARTNKAIPPVQRDIWRKWEQLQPLPEMQQLVTYLRETGYPVGLLTNVTPVTEQEIRSGGGYNGFDFLIKSCEVGFAKPDPEIYEMALQCFKNLSPHEVVFVDDRERFLVPARKLGMQVILSLRSEQVINDIRKLLKTS